MTNSTLPLKRAVGRLACTLAICAGLIWIGLVSPAAASQSDEADLRLASDVWPPFTDVAQKPRFAIDLVHEALKRSGVKARTDIVDWSKVTPALRKGEVDGSAAIWRNAKRDEFLLFSAPFLENRLVVVGRKGSDVSAQSFAELKGKRVAIVAGYAYGEDVDGSSAPEFVEGTSNQANLEKLLAEKVDYMLIDDLVIRHVLTHQREEATAALEVGVVPLVRRPLHLALRNDLPAAAAILKRFDEQIKRMRADGTFNRLLNLRWIIADVDGDGLLEHVLRGLEAGEEAPTTDYSIEVTDSLEPTERVMIDGDLYVNWGAVPQRFKVQSQYERIDPQDGIVLLRF